MELDLNDVVPFLEWFPKGLFYWLMVVTNVAGIAAVVAWLVAAIRHGPTIATQRTLRLLRDAAADLIGISPRRVLALTWLSVKESIRRRVVVIFAVFILILSFAGWFLDPASINPARLYLGFVLTATSYLILLLALFLSSLSLPADIKNKTLYTIVTKPVRASEIVLGRILGFATVGTCLLVIMGLACYIFVQRGLAHTHQLAADDLQSIEGAVSGESLGLHGKTKREQGHSHKVTIDPSGQGHVEMEQGHFHKLTTTKDDDKVAYEIGSAEGMFQARVPIYGKLSFRDRTGRPAEKGINTGDEWGYRSYIQGGTLAAAVWTFDGITEAAFPNGLPIEMTLGVFRTHTGNIEKGVAGCLAVKNPKTNEKVDVRIFESKEFVTDVQPIANELQAANGERRDLFRDLVDNGKVEIWLTCVEPEQYFGAAQADLYIRASNASFFLNFAKGYFGIWLQMMLVIGLGVMFSTFLSGPVAMLATLGAVLGGFFDAFMFDLAAGKTYGGGPAESAVRMISQEGVTVEMEPGLRTTTVLAFDKIATVWIKLMASILPDFGRFSFSDYVAYGFNVSGDTALTFACRALGFLFPVFVAAYLCLKTREVAK